MGKESLIIVFIMAIVAFIVFYVIGKYNRNKIFLGKVETKWNDTYELIEKEIELMIKYANIVKEEVKTEEIVCNEILIITDNYKNISEINELINNYDEIEKCFKKINDIYNNNNLSKNKEINKIYEDLSNFVNKIEYSKEIYNNELNDYYSSTSSFISNLICKLFKFKRYNIFR